MPSHLVTIKLTQEELRRLFDLIGKGALAESEQDKSRPVFSEEDTFLRNYIGAMALHTVRFTPDVRARVELSSF